MSSARIDLILRSIESLREPVHVRGSTASARALVFLEAFKNPRINRQIVICPTDDAALELAQDFETLQRVLKFPPASVQTLPSWDFSPYSGVTPSIRTRFCRAAALAEFTLSKIPVLLTTTLEGANQFTLSPQFLRSHSLEFTINQDAGDREALLRAFLDLGYLRTETVEDPGSFAVRGEIIDLYPPHRDKPIRIEFFDTLVERIREFDPGTQRTLTEPLHLLKTFVLPPAREILLNSKTLPYAREQIKNWSDEKGVHRSIRDPLIGQIVDGIYPERADFWAPFTYEKPSTLWDYRTDATLLSICDELSCQQNYDASLARYSEEFLDAMKTGSVVPEPNKLFLKTPDFSQALTQALFFDQISLANLEVVGAPEPSEQADPKSESAPSSMLSVLVKTNADLADIKRQSFEDLEPKFKQWIQQGYEIYLLAQAESQLERLKFLLGERNIAAEIGVQARAGQVVLHVGSLSGGLRWPAEGLVIITEDELLGARKIKKRRKRMGETSAAKDWSGLQALTDLGVGDYIVHIDHGIGRYQGLVRLDLLGAASDFLLLEYAGRDKLYLPVYRLNVVQKYVGAGSEVALDKLGSQQFAKTKEKVRGEVKKLAIDLIQLYAERKVRPGVPFSPRDSEFRAFESAFPFEETPDQLKAIDDTLADLESGRAMDRLICGDVGYGKTEVALRAAFRAVSDGKQVAVLVPTTILCQQHEQSFRARLKDYPIQIDSVSRFKNTREQKIILDGVEKGKVDIIIGTHRLLSKDVRFGALGLIIVDEEHRFGVEHKERLKTLKTNVHVLTLTATPIPRTLHMALSGLRDISLINTPPVDRLPIRTYVSKFDEALIKRAIDFELSRGGQVFFVHNRVETIYETASMIRELVPSSKIVVGHGQMSEGELENTMLEFYEKRANILVCTSIIESGLDIPSANTLIVDRADHFGLAQLYQIRGRVGRGQSRGYAYLLIPVERAISDDAKKRLDVIQRFVELGSGFSIASHDLEIRGGGDLLGPQQSGQINAVGFDLYTELLEEAIHELQGKPESTTSHSCEPEIKAPFPAFLDEAYVPDVHQRLSLYRRCSAAENEESLVQLELELQERFGALPPAAQNLLALIRIKILLKRLGVDTLTVGPEKVVLTPGNGSSLDPARAVALVASQPKRFQITPESKFIVAHKTVSLQTLYLELESLFRTLLPSVSP